MPWGGLLTVGITAAIKAYQAKKASDASKKASQQQQVAADEARKYSEARYRVAEDLVHPYRQAGIQGLEQLRFDLGAQTAPRRPGTVAPWIPSEPARNYRGDIQTMAPPQRSASMLARPDRQY